MLADTRMRKLALTKIRYLRPPVGWLRRKSQSPTIDSDLTPSGSSLCSKGNSAARPVPPPPVARLFPTAGSGQQAAGSGQQAAGNSKQDSQFHHRRGDRRHDTAAYLRLPTTGSRQQAAGNTV